MTIFFLWASVHVIHQVAYVTDAYRMKDPRGWDWTGRMIDYGLLATAMYPIATEKFIRGEFQTGGRTLLFPEFLKQPWVAWPVWALFIGFALAFVWKSVREYREGRLHFAKTLLIVIASVLFFLTPTLANLDVAFQGLNTWHSFQYLAIVLYLNRYRAARGMIGSPFVTKVSHRGFTLYAMCLGFTILTALLYFGVLSLAVGAHLFETGSPFKMLLVRPRLLGPALLRVLQRDPVVPADPLLLRPLHLPATGPGHHPQLRASVSDSPTDERARLRHDLRTPLHQIIGYAELLEDEVKDAGQPSLAADLQKMQAAARRALELVDRCFPPAGDGDADADAAKVFREAVDDPPRRPAMRRCCRRCGRRPSRSSRAASACWWWTTTSSTATCSRAGSAAAASAWPWPRTARAPSRWSRSRSSRWCCST